MATDYAKYYIYICNVRRKWVSDLGPSLWPVDEVSQGFQQHNICDNCLLFD